MPKDDMLNVNGTKFTQTVKRVTAQIAASDSFKDTSANLKYLCGIDVSAKEAERIAEDIGAEIITAKQDEIAYSLTELTPPAPESPAEILYVEYNGTGVPIRKQELARVNGKPVRDAESATYFSQIGQLDDFGKLLYSEAVQKSNQKKYV